MSININVTKKMKNGYAQVEVESPKVPTRYFKVPQAKTDEFCKDYKQFNKDQSIFSAIRIFTPVLLLCGIANYFTKNKGKLINWAAGLGVSIAAMLGTMQLNTKILMKKEDKLLQKHGAEEIINEPKRMPFLNKSK